MKQTHVGDQFQLDLRDRRAPWGGQSPRFLTKAHAKFSLAADGASRSIQDAPRVVDLVFLKGNPHGT